MNVSVAQEFADFAQRLQGELLQLDRLNIEPERIRQAAVTLILRDEAADPQVLLIQRAEHPRDPWSGHLALPGGRAEAHDADLLATATRETWEEIGLDLAAGGQFLGRLPKLTPRNPRLPQIEITPFVAIAPVADFQLRLSEEVAAVFWLSLRQLKLAGMTSQFTLEQEGQTRAWPAFASPRGPIWGITGHILNDFLTRFD